MSVSSNSETPGKAGLAVIGAKAVFAAGSRLATSPLRWYWWNGAPVLFKDVFFAALRSVLSNLTIAQSRYIYKSTTETYSDLYKEVGEEAKSIDLEEHNVKAHWIGQEDADVVILYLHGGGYTQSCTTEHMKYLRRLITDVATLSSGTKSISFLLPAYTLAPEARFPTQLQQTAAVLSHVLEERDRSPSSIMIAGDSAGGGLALSLLSHLLHPHSHVKSISLSAPLCGIFLYSPWVSFDTTHDSYARNATKDVMVPNMLRKWASMYLGTADGEQDPLTVKGGDSYSEPLRADASWWSGMHQVVQGVLIWGGEDEVFIDGLRQFAAQFEQGWTAGGGKVASVETLFAADTAHIGPIMDVMLQYKKKSEATVAVENWLNRYLE